MHRHALPYNPIAQVYRQKFQARVQKISVAVAETCPNREGLRGMQTCNFCDQWGSAAYHENLNRSLKEQIERVRPVMAEKHKATKFLVYFQAYTTTFASTRKLRDQFLTALEYPDIVGLVIGTRPDCVSEAFIEVCQEMSTRTYVAVEMGLQSFDEEILKWLRRGHTAEQSIKAITKIHQAAPQISLGAHIIFGAPTETEQHAIQAAQKLNAMPIDNVKLHHLHVLKNTPLADDYARGEFVPLEKDAYFERCTLFLQHLSPKTAVHRLSAFSPRWDELVAPSWTSFRMKTYQDMLEYMWSRKAYQGQLYEDGRGAQESLACDRGVDRTDQLSDAAR
jgi:radical SAM protein (TIGR01212 family)